MNVWLMSTAGAVACPPWWMRGCSSTHSTPRPLQNEFGAPRLLSAAAASLPATASNTAAEHLQGMPSVAFLKDALYLWCICGTTVRVRALIVLVRIQAVSCVRL
jgi:hypothetical protein